MQEENSPEEKSLFERIGGGGSEDNSLIKKVAGFAPWLVVIGKKDKQKTYNWHKKNLKMVIAAAVILLFVAVIWDQSGGDKAPTNAESRKFTNPTEILNQQNALPEVNPNDVRSNNLPADPGL
jgi:hypothetical protein